MKNNLNMPYIWTISVVAALGGLLFGYDWVVIGGAKPFYEAYFNIEHGSNLEAWAMSCALLGCLIGTTISGALTNKFGRIKLLIIAGFLFTCSAIGTAFAYNLNSFIIYRILGGIGIGLASNLSPMYIAEITPSSMRGRFVSINQLTIVIGVVSAQLINWLIAEHVPENFSVTQIASSWNGQNGWRWMFGAEVVPASLFFIMMFFLPESPRWLMQKEKSDKAQKVLGRIGGIEYAKLAVSEIKQSILESKNQSGFEAFKQKRFLKILLVGVFLAVYQQWCGINVIFNFANDIFQSAGFGIDTILINIVATGTVSLIFTFIAIYTVDTLGRRKLMRIGAGGLAVLFTAIGIAFMFNIGGIFLLSLILLAIACYSSTLAPIVWVILSEIYPTKIRGAAMSVSTFSLWSACFILTYTFPLLFNRLGDSSPFWIYGVISVIGFIFISIKLPETKGKSLEQIEKELVG